VWRVCEFVCVKKSVPACFLSLSLDLCLGVDDGEKWDYMRWAAICEGTPCLRNATGGGGLFPSPMIPGSAIPSLPILHNLHFSLIKAWQGHLSGVRTRPPTAAHHSSGGCGECEGLSILPTGPRPPLHELSAPMGACAHPERRVKVWVGIEKQLGSLAVQPERLLSNHCTPLWPLLLAPCSSGFEWAQACERKLHSEARKCRCRCLGATDRHAST